MLARIKCENTYRIEKIEWLKVFLDHKFFIFFKDLKAKIKDRIITF